MHQAPNVADPAVRRAFNASAHRAGPDAANPGAHRAEVRRGRLRLVRRWRRRRVRVGRGVRLRGQVPSRQPDEARQHRGQGILSPRLNHCDGAGQHLVAHLRQLRRRGQSVGRRRRPGQGFESAERGADARFEIRGLLSGRGFTIEQIQLIHGRGNGQGTAAALVANWQLEWRVGDFVEYAAGIPSGFVGHENLSCEVRWEVEAGRAQQLVVAASH
jgi:hypothetical protein